jgi:hypothetical protein
MIERSPFQRLASSGKSSLDEEGKKSGDGGTRTLDPLNAIEVLSQLSYIPT